MDQKSKIEKVYSQGERRVFEPDANGDWRLVEHAPAPGKDALKLGSLMDDIFPPVFEDEQIDG
tara:strand:+ start:715 stop:903 length:189 start_codon:yes stop_codon:yes gene_type:complete